MKSLFLFLPFLCLCGCANFQTKPVESQTEQPPSNYNPEAELERLQVELPSSSSPIANYVNAVRTDNLIFLAGKGPKNEKGDFITGKVGVDLTLEQGYEAARLTGLAQLGALKEELGNLRHVKRIVKVTGMVNCSTDFTQHPEVINGYSDLMVEIFGERGKHARAAVGMNSLPRNIAVEIEMVVEVFD